MKNNTLDRDIEKMADHASAKKRIRTNARRNEINTARTSRLRTFIKKVETAIAGGDAKVAEAAFKNVQPELLRGVSKNIIAKNTAARKLSRLSARIKALKK
jgi:small subunit ribosomal protein S20